MWLWCWFPKIPHAFSISLKMNHITIRSNQEKVISQTDYFSADSLILHHDFVCFWVHRFHLQCTASRANLDFACIVNVSGKSSWFRFIGVAWCLDWWCIDGFSVGLALKMESLQASSRYKRLPRHSSSVGAAAHLKLDPLVSFWFLHVSLSLD